MVNKTKLKKFSKEVSFPLALIVLYFFLFRFQKFIALPSQNQFIELILNFVNNQSLVTIFLIALFEGGLILGQYAPGGVVIFLSIISAQGDILRIALLVSIISIAYLIAYSIDYMIGYYGINTIAEKFGLHKHILRYKKRLEANEFATIFFTYWETNIASIVAAAAGSLQVSFKRFFLYSAICVFFWNVFWATNLILFGEIILRIFGYEYLLIIVLIWIGFIFYKHFIKKEEREKLKDINI